jgi:squalene-hopene/tetraprenyl-beta-curcumene cyclase
LSESTQSYVDFETAKPTLARTVKKGTDYLLLHQHKDGCWSGELEADASVTAGYIPLMYFMTGKVDGNRQKRIINYLKSKQTPNGSWSAYFGGPGDLNVSIQVYFALKLAGISANEPIMQSAKQFIIGKGGISNANVFTKIWLALFGQFDWSLTPSVPPELIFLPNWSYFSIYDFGSWSRATIMALSIVTSMKPVCMVPETAHVNELYTSPGNNGKRDIQKRKSLLSWSSFFLLADSIYKALEKFPFKPGHASALRRVEKWILEHQEKDGSWGGIMLPWIYALIGLKSLGYKLDNPVIVKGIKGLEGFIIDDEFTTRMLPATSPVWDTAWSVIALAQSGLSADHPALCKSARWLLSKEINVEGDWRVKTKSRPGCWSFEFENRLYPDIDDTAVVPRALLKVHLSRLEESQKKEAVQRGVNWVLAMQGKNGGWAAFDRNNNKQILAHIPFADFMTPLDPTSPDVTAHVIELLGEVKTSHVSLSKSLEYLKEEQLPDGAWYGRWGVNYIYGTGLVLSGLRAAHEDMTTDYVRKAVKWLESCQNQDGGWGESCSTYDEPGLRGKGPSTASQTAWALIGLMAAGETDNLAVKRGIDYLIANQANDGSWLEDYYTGTGFPRAFYLRYDLYRVYFPLLALTQYQTYLEEVENGH